MSNQESGLQWHDIDDALFFKEAINKCSRFTNDLGLVKRVHSILMKDKNIKFLNDDYLYNFYLYYLMF